MLMNVNTSLYRRYEIYNIAHILQGDLDYIIHVELHQNLGKNKLQQVDLIYHR